MRRWILTMLLAAAVPAAHFRPAVAESSLLDLGKSVLKQQMQGTTSSGSTSGGSSLGQSLSATDIAAGLKEALKTGTAKVTGQLGAKDGFNADPAVHIPLPGTLQKVQSGLKMVGMSGLADDLELRLNRAAEAAAPQAKAIFWKAVESMTLDDARSILNGPQDGATQYFKKAMTPDLKTAMRPIVDEKVAEAGAVKSLDSLTAAAKGLAPGVDGKAMLSDHVLDYALSGLFSYLGKEEAAIRSDPAQRTSDLLRKVFGG